MLHQGEKYIKLINIFLDTDSALDSSKNEFSKQIKNDKKSKKIYRIEIPQKYKRRIPMVSHRGCSKGGLNEPVLNSELKNFGNEIFLKAEHGNYGEDAFFVVQTKVYLVFGIADGVGGWWKHGIDPAIFSASLVKHACRNSIKFIKMFEHKKNSNCKDNISALDVMQAAYNDLIEYDGDNAFGSSTACFGVYNYKTKELNIANLGDSGIYIRTSSKFEFLSNQMQHCSGSPFQLTNPPIEERCYFTNLDFPKDAVLHKFQLSEGDYFIVGSDGVWDNIDIQNMHTNLKCGAYCVESFSNSIKKRKKMAESFSDTFFDEVVANSKWPFCFERLNNGENPNIADHGHFYGAKKDDISLIMVLV